MSKKLLLTILLVPFFLLLAQPAHAAITLISSGEECTDPTEDSLACCIADGDCTLANGVEFLTRVGTFMLGITGSLVLAVFVYGGFLWVTAAGNADKVKKGRDAMIGSVIGMLIVFSAGMIVTNLKSILQQGGVLEGEEIVTIDCHIESNDGLVCGLNEVCDASLGQCVSKCFKQYPLRTCMDYNLESATNCVQNLCPGSDEIRCCEVDYIP